MMLVTKLTSVLPYQNVLGTLATVGQQDINQLPALDRGRLVGMVGRADLIKWMSVPRLGIPHGQD